MSETNNSTAAVSLKDYIIDLDGAKQKPSVAYEVVLENNTDFILRRQTQKVQKELVILVSQGLYYIRDCKNGAIDPVTIGNLRSFLRDLKDSYIDLQQVNWLGTLFKESAEFIITVTGDAVLTDMCRHNVPMMSRGNMCSIGSKTSGFSHGWHSCSPQMPPPAGSIRTVSRSFFGLKRVTAPTRRCILPSSWFVLGCGI